MFLKLKVVTGFIIGAGNIGERETNAIFPVSLRPQTSLLRKTGIVAINPSRLYRGDL